MNKEDAMDHCKWRKMIKDVWVSVSSGTGLPGLSRTKASNGCVCVCVWCWCGYLSGARC